jgi:hypothetical protein
MVIRSVVVNNAGGGLLTLSSNAIDGKAVTKAIATPLIAVTAQNVTTASIKPFIYASTCGS